MLGEGGFEPGRLFEGHHEVRPAPSPARKCSGFAETRCIYLYMVGGSTATDDGCVSSSKQPAAGGQYRPHCSESSRRSAIRSRFLQLKPGQCRSCADRNARWAAGGQGVIKCVRARGGAVAADCGQDGTGLAQLAPSIRDPFIAFHSCWIFASLPGWISSE